MCSELTADGSYSMVPAHNRMMLTRSISGVDDSAADDDHDSDTGGVHTIGGRGGVMAGPRSTIPTLFSAQQDEIGDIAHTGPVPALVRPSSAQVRYVCSPERARMPAL